MAEILKNESYWKDPDGSVNENGHALADAYKNSSRKYVQPLREDGMCSICIEEGGPRSLKKVAETSKAMLDVWLCEVCDGDAFDIVCSQP